MNKESFKIELLNLSEKLHLAILNFQKEFHTLEKNNIETTKIDEFNEHIKYIVGALTIQILAIQNILDIINKNEQYFQENINNLNVFLTKTKNYCSTLLD